MTHQISLIFPGFASTIARAVLTATLASLALPACQRGGTPEPSACVPGRAIACVGPGGCAGGQMCEPGGGGFGPCACTPFSDGFTQPDAVAAPTASDGGAVDLVSRDMPRDADDRGMLPIGPDASMASDSAPRGVAADLASDSSAADSTIADASRLDGLVEAAAPAAPDVRTADAAVLDETVLKAARDNADAFAFVVNVVSGGASCSGTLLSRRHVLTAAHCVCPAHDQQRDARHCNSGASVRLHSYTRSLDTVIYTEQVTVHGSYLSHLDAAGHVVDSVADLAILTLEADAPEWAGVATLADSASAVSTKVVVVGYGQTSCNPLWKDFSNWAGDRFFGSNAIASDKWVDLTCIVGDSSDKAAALTTHGDSGGPLLLANNRRELAGVTSVGACQQTFFQDATQANGLACFTKTDIYRDWIRRMVEPPPPCPPNGCGGTCPNTCSAGFICVAQHCDPCGTDGRACCEGATACANGLTCQAGRCAACVPSCASRCGGAPDGCKGTCSGSCSLGAVCVGQTCNPCGAAGQPCCAGASPCGSPLVCRKATGTCETDITRTSKITRFVSLCSSAHWHSRGECFPHSSDPTAGCGCAASSGTRLTNTGCTATTCWKRESGFWTYNSDPGYASFSPIFHCFEGGANRYSRSGCSTFGDPSSIGWVANNPVGNWATAIYLCEWSASGVIEQFLTQDPVECTGHGGSVLSPRPFGYVVP